MDAYIKKVRAVANLRDGTPIYNSSKEHASVLAAAMFEYASSEVCILTGKLDALVYGRENVIEHAKLFLSTTDHKIKVLVEEPDKLDIKDHPFTREFSEHADVELRILDEKYEHVPFHFIVMDRDSYRFEKDKSVPAAIAAFGDKVGGQNLTEIFDEMWENSGTKLAH